MQQLPVTKVVSSVLSPADSPPQSPPGHTSGCGLWGITVHREGVSSQVFHLSHISRSLATNHVPVQALEITQQWAQVGLQVFTWRII